MKNSPAIFGSAHAAAAMSRVFEEIGSNVFGSDLYDRGYGECRSKFFLRHRDLRITSLPIHPYNCAEGFVANGIKHANHKLNPALRLAFLEGANRANTIFAKRRPRGSGFSERITFYPRESKGSGDCICMVCLG